jgi:hypothetical protein
MREKHEQARVKELNLIAASEYKIKEQTRWGAG